jgi:hypothetical protein
LNVTKIIEELRFAMMCDAGFVKIMHEGVRHNVAGVSLIVGSEPINVAIITTPNDKVMNTRQLIAELEKCDPEGEVQTYHDDGIIGGWNEVRFVAIPTDEPHTALIFSGEVICTCDTADNA